MGRGKPLTDFEKGQIKGYIESGLKHYEIAKKIGRSQNVVSNFLRNEADYGKKWMEEKNMQQQHRRGDLSYELPQIPTFLLVKLGKNAA